MFSLNSGNKALQAPYRMHHRLWVHVEVWLCGDDLLFFVLQVAGVSNHRSCAQGLVSHWHQAALAEDMWKVKTLELPLAIRYLGCCTTNNGTPWDKKRKAPLVARRGSLL